MKKSLIAFLSLILVSAPALAAMTADGHFDESLKHLAAKNFPAALEELKAAEAVLSGDDKLLAAIYANRGIVHANLSQPDEAIEYFNKSLSIEKRVPRLHLFLGRAYLVKGKNREAVASFLEALKTQTLVKDPKMLPVHDDLWRAYAALGRQAGYDREIALREIYHLEAAVAESPALADEASVTKERKFLAGMLSSEETPGEKGDLPADGISAAEKNAALEKAKSAL